MMRRGCYQSCCTAIIIKRVGRDPRDWHVGRCQKRTVFLSDYCPEHLAQRVKRVVVSD